MIRDASGRAWQSADAHLLRRPVQPRTEVVHESVTIIDVAICPRCSGRHRGLEMRCLRQPSGAFVVDGERVRLVAWSTCPRTGEPITHAELDR